MVGQGHSQPVGCRTSQAGSFYQLGEGGRASFKAIKNLGGLIENAYSGTTIFRHGHAYFRQVAKAVHTG